MPSARLSGSLSAAHRERALLALFALWALCFGLNLFLLLQDRLMCVPVQLATPAADAYPEITGFLPGEAALAGDLRIGDHLTRVGESDLRGVGQLGFVARAYDQSVSGRTVTVRVNRNGEERPVTLALVPIHAWSAVPVSVCLAVLGLLILLRAPPSRSSWMMALAFLVYAIYWTHFFGGPPLQTYAWLIVRTVAAVFFGPLLLLAVDAMVPDSRPRTARVPRWPWLFVAYAPFGASKVLGWPVAAATTLHIIAFADIAFIVAMALMAIQKYRHADQAGRRRVKWVVYAIFIGCAPVALASSIASVIPSLWWLKEVSTVALTLGGACIFIAVGRFHLFDIDRLISATATYSVVTVLLIGAVLIVAPRAAHAASIAMGLEAGAGQTFFSFLLAALVVPVQRRLRPALDRLFFAERRALEQGVEQLLSDLSAKPGADAMLALVGKRLDSLLRPDCCVIYARVGGTFEPVYARAPIVPPTFSPGAAVLERLGQRNVALVLGGPGGPAPDRDARDRAALESLGARLLLPIKHGPQLVAFLCLGEKRSGDVYINTDLALLGAVCSRISSELQRFDIEDVRARSRAMQESLRRYVPAAVAEVLERGTELEADTRDVSILFVDIRGYTRYSESHTAAEIFAMLNRYTEAVSGVVRKHRGSLVEFNGDGLMAVYGAPQLIDAKERAAVASALEIVQALRALELGRTSPDHPRLEVGIGIATGAAFVGNIRAVDRMIWGAIGNTTNLAARLQGLSRDLGCSIVLDQSTYVAAGDIARRFRLHRQLPIRGRSQKQDIYAIDL